MEKTRGRRRVTVRVRNTLDEASGVHWHGMHLPAAMDGGPHRTVGAGGTWTPRRKAGRPASTLWYHPHPHGATERHVRKGLAGMFLLDDEHSGRLALPKTYGVDDLPVMVRDVTFDGADLDHGHGFLANTGFLGEGMTGQFVVVEKRQRAGEPPEHAGH
ncbi:multicopper oxidase domain-containing protein [Streptomyces sp. NPDC045714]|uniref:multicopper oxidase domain-containing protein n=1 Tax=Streptomyces sp. NPDC045714 TaxID=3154913 RepID=UPI0033FCB2C0